MKFKKIIAAVMAAAMCTLGLAGCSSDGGSGSSGSGNSSSSANSESAGTSENSETAGADYSDKILKVG